MKADKFFEFYSKGIKNYYDGKKDDAVKMFEKSLTAITPSKDIAIIKINIAIREDIRKIIRKIKSEK